MSVPRTWIDVTDLLAWAGPPTGIPRVVANLVARYARRPDVGLFVFSDRSNTFKSVDIREVLIRRAAARIREAPEFQLRTGAKDGSIAYRMAAEARQRLPWNIRRRLRPLKSAGEAVVARLRRHVRPGFSVLLRFVRALARAFVASARDPRRLMTRAESRRVRFGPGDRVLVLGSGWGSYSMQEALAERKRTAGIRIFQIIYDVTPVLLPHSFGPGFAETFAKYLFEAASLSDGLVAISQQTRADALRFCADLLIPPPPIEVFRLGDEIGRVDGAPQSVRGLVDTQFILSVGTFEARKNYGLLYQAWKLALDRGLSLPNLVIVGRRGWGAGDTWAEISRDPQVRNDVRVLNDVDDAQLDWLYEHCLFTLYPSMYEGWGLPIAESLARGKLCLASSASAMPEVAGELIEYFSPFSASECLDRVAKYLDPAVLKAKEEEISRNYASTSWDVSFIQFDSALSRLQAHLEGPASS